MKLKTICIANQKGGIGKSTVSQNTAGALAILEKNILLVDLDPQGNTTKSIFPEPITDTVLHIFEGEKILPLKTQNPHIEILPACNSLSGITSKMATDYDVLFKLKDYLNTLSGYDYVITDTPPTLLHLTLAGMIAADYLLIPVSTQYYSLQGTNDLIESMQKIQHRLNPNLKLLGACISMHDKRTALAGEVYTEIKNHFNGNLFDAIIPKTVKVEEAQVNCKTVIDLYPEADVSKQYMQLAREIMERTS